MFYIVCYSNVRLSQFRLLALLFCYYGFLFGFPFFICFCFIFCSYSFIFFLFFSFSCLPPPSVSLSFVRLHSSSFPSLFSSFFSLSCCCFSSFGFPALFTPPPFSAPPWSAFSCSSRSPSRLLLAFLLVHLSILLSLFSLLLSDPTIFYYPSSSLSSAPLPSSSSASSVLSFFVFSSSIGRFFLPSFPFLASSFSLVFLLPPVLFSHTLLLSLSFCFLYLSFRCAFISFPFVCTWVLAICGFVFVSSFLPFQLYSSAVSSLFCSPVAFCSTPLHLLSPLGPLRSSSLFLLWLWLRVGLLSSFCSGLPMHSFLSLTFCIVASSSCGGLLSHHLITFPCVGNPAPGLSLRLCSPRLVVFSSAAPALFSICRGGGGYLDVLCSLSTFLS